MISPAVRSENIKKLRELMQGIAVAMLTTTDETGRLTSRPMATQRKPFDGTLWFFIKARSPNGDGAQTPKHVVVNYVNKEKNLYLSISGKAVIERDLSRMEEHWFSGLNSWFPGGLDDPELALMTIEVQEAEYWDGPDNAVEKMVGFVRAFASRASYNGNSNERLELE